MNKNCITCKKNFTIHQRDEQFYQKVAAPLPQQCPDCRLQKRLAYRNERALFPDECDLCHKPMLSLYKPSDHFTVYCQTCWWSDNWEATSFGQDIDWNRSLIQQWNEVRRQMPRLALVSMNSDNSDYTNMCADNKDCYLLFASENCENCSYGKLVQKCKDCFDCCFTYDSELCYQCVNVRHCYQSIYLQDSQDSRECGYSIGLRGCSNVFLSSNLHNKEYYILNQPVKPEEYAQRVAELMQGEGSRQKCYEQWRALNQRRVVKAAELLKCDSCTGDNLTDCKRVYDSFDITGGQDCSYLTDALDPRDCYDASFIYYKPELVYDSLSMLQCYNTQYSVFTFYTSDSQYCDQVHNSHDILLSSCVRSKQFVILNKQYTQEEYFQLKQQVIKKMKGEGLAHAVPNGNEETPREYGYLPQAQHSLFAYNDTVANEYFPLTKEQAVTAGYAWNDEADERVTKPFNITKPEAAFYKLMHLPEPTVHPELRHRMRMALRNPRRLIERPCQNCGASCLSSYPEASPEQVYCEKCYQQAIY